MSSFIEAQNKTWDFTERGFLGRSLGMGPKQLKFKDYQQLYRNISKNRGSGKRCFDLLMFDE
jgi:hypothetical protein